MENACFTPGSTTEKASFTTPASTTEKVSFTTPASSTSSPSRIFCRICHDDGDLISPCRCCGSVGLIHLSCLEKWLSTSNQSGCEICGHEFVVEKQAKPFSQWACKSNEQRHMTGDIVCFLILTPLAILSAYFCGVGAAHYFDVEHQSAEAAALISLVSFLTLVYLMWLILTLRFHCKTYGEWKKTNQIIRLVEVVTEATPKS